MSDSESSDNLVRGERTSPAITRERAMSSRVSSILAMSLMSTLGLGLLIWYYANTLLHQSGARQSAQEVSRHRAQGDQPLPSLGPIEPPQRISTGTSSVGAAESGIPLDVPLTADTRQPEPPVVAAVPEVVPPKSAAQLILERQLSGAAFAAQTGTALALPTVSNPPGGQSHDGANRESGSLAAFLQPAVSAAVRAQVLPSLQLLLPKGAFIDCTLETAIDSTLPGMTTCVTATDTFGVDGKVVLLERGTKLVGETRGQVQQGAARVFVLWDEARTPTGVVVPLASPGADELGRAGLPGEVNRHFWDRFGAAMLISVLDGAVQAMVQSSRNGGGAVIIDPATSEGVGTEALKGTVAIPPTIQKSQGDRIQVMVARDLDFRTVYALRADAGGP
jgi:type IV secretion system protein VirB10